MTIRISGKFSQQCYTAEELRQMNWLTEGLVFVSYLEEDIRLGDVFLLEDGTEIILSEIQIEFAPKGVWETMTSGWKCLCRFENIDLGTLPAVPHWHTDIVLTAAKKEAPETN